MPAIRVEVRDVPGGPQGQEERIWLGSGPPPAGASPLPAPYLEELSLAGAAPGGDTFRRALLLGGGAALLYLAAVASHRPLTLLHDPSPAAAGVARALAALLAELLSPPPKGELRARLEGWRESLPARSVEAWSEAAREALCRLPAYRAARRLLLYLSVANEVDTHPLLARALREGKRVFAPRVDREHRRLLVGEVHDPRQDLEPGPFRGILEPRHARAVTPGAAFDLVVVPGVAFDRFGNRIGRGAGYYDRLLATLAPGTPTVGLLFAGQIVPRCPAGPRDRPVHALATEEGPLPLWPPLSDEGSQPPSS